MPQVTPYQYRINDLTNVYRYYGRWYISNPIADKEDIGSVPIPLLMIFDTPEEAIQMCIKYKLCTPEEGMLALLL